MDALFCAVLVHGRAYSRFHCLAHPPHHSPSSHPFALAGGVRSIIEGYTSEAGVRSLSRCLAAICRHVAVQVVQQREEEGSSAPLLGGLLGANSGGGSSEQPDLPPGLEEAAARAAAAQGVAANSGAAMSLAALHSMQAMHSRGGGMLVQPPSAGRDNSAMQLWAQLLPLAGSPAAVAATATATGGYPWRQLQPPMRSNTAAAEAAAAATQCTCPSRKQPRWFSWLRWARHDGTAEQAQQEASCGGSGEAAHPCSCAGRCGEPDCCCHSHASREQPVDGAAGHEIWGPPGEAGMAADSSSWEASWRQSALAREPPRLCGPGSMQVLRPPLAEALVAAGGGSLNAAPRLAVGVAAAAAAARAAAGRQHGAGLALLLDGLPEASGAGEQGWPSVSRQQQEQQQAIVVNDALIEVVLGPRRFEGHNNAGGQQETRETGGRAGGCTCSAAAPSQVCLPLFAVCWQRNVSQSQHSMAFTWCSTCPPNACRACGLPRHCRRPGVDVCGRQSAVH